jgi:hypothetical protein
MREIERKEDLPIATKKLTILNRLPSPLIDKIKRSPYTFVNVRYSFPFPLYLSANLERKKNSRM